MTPAEAVPIVNRVILNPDNTLTVFTSRNGEPLTLQQNDPLYALVLRAHAAAVQKATALSQGVEAPKESGAWSKIGALFKWIAKKFSREKPMPPHPAPFRAPQFPPPDSKVAHPLVAQESAPVHEHGVAPQLQQPRTAAPVKSMAAIQSPDVQRIPPVLSATTIQPAAPVPNTANPVQQKAQILFENITWDSAKGYTVALGDGRTVQLAKEEKMAEEFHALMRQLGERVKQVAAARESIEQEKEKLAQRARELDARESKIEKERSSTRRKRPVKAAEKGSGEPTGNETHEKAVQAKAETRRANPQSEGDKEHSDAGAPEAKPTTTLAKVVTAKTKSEPDPTNASDEVGSVERMLNELDEKRALVFIRPGVKGEPEAYAYVGRNLIQLELHRDQAARAKEVMGEGLLTVAAGQKVDDRRGSVTGVIDLGPGIGRHPVDEKLDYIIGDTQLTGATIEDAFAVKAIVADIENAERIECHDGLKDQRSADQLNAQREHAKDQAHSPAQQQPVSAAPGGAELAKEDATSGEDALANPPALSLEEINAVEAGRGPQDTSEPDASFEELPKIRPVGKEEFSRIVQTGKSDAERAAEPTTEPTENLDPFADYEKRKRQGEEPAMSRS